MSDRNPSDEEPPRRGIPSGGPNPPPPPPPAEGSESAGFWRGLFEAADPGVWVLDAAGRIRYVSARLAELLSRSSAQMRGRPFTEFVARDQQAAAETLIERGRGHARRADLPLLRRDGSRVWSLVAATPLPEGTGMEGGSVLWVTDVSARRRLEMTLARRARRLAAAAELGQRGLVGLSEEALLREATGLVARVLETELTATWELLPGGQALRLRAGVGWRDGLVGEATVAAGDASHPGFVLDAGEPTVIDNLLEEERFSPFLLREHRVLTGAGTILYRPEGPWGVLAAYSTRHRPFDVEDLDFLITVATLLASGLERRRVEAELRATRERFDLLKRATHDVIWDRDLVRETMWWSAALEERLGYAPGELEPSPATWERLIHEEDRERVRTGWRRALEGSGDAWTDVYRLRGAGGVTVEVYDRGHIVRDAAGRPLRALGAASDIGPRRKPEERRQPARGTEAVRRLAGSVAHELNDELTAILGYAELLMQDLPREDPRREDVEEIRSAARRSADATRRLLTLGGRPLVRPGVLDPAAAVTELEEVLRREAGPQVRLVTAPAGPAWPVRMERDHLAEILLQLVSNARRAMPQGGELAVEVSSVELEDPLADEIGLLPGDYVRLAVRDTGVGMEEETRDRAFDPFFTAWGDPAASGLGLSSVYGIVRQGGGGVELKSARGEGTTVRVYLPRAPEPATPVT